MSSDYYFKKWKETLVHLEHLTHIDTEYQEAKVHDQKLCQATERLSGILGNYMAIYNDALLCLQQNLQVQKTPYIADILRAIVARIMELKHQLSNLDNSNYQFLANGLINHKLTTHDADFIDIPEKIQRAEHLTAVIEEVIKKAEIERERLDQAEDAPDEETEEEGKIWWEEEKAEELQEKVLQEKVSEETLKKRETINLILAHEKTRQVTKLMKHEKIKREKWVKEMEGSLKPQAREEVKKRAANLIQEVFRYYFKRKRKIIMDCKIEELLGIRRCKKLSEEVKKKAEEESLVRAQKYELVGNEWKGICDEMKQEYMKNNAEDIADDFRDFLRNWLQQWFNKVQFFYDIPTEKQGGSTLILKEMVPSPGEWLAQYNACLAKKKADKSKSPEELKHEKKEAKREAMMLKREQQLKDRQAANMLKKLMKNPTKHPGYHFPKSKKTGDVVKAVENYHKDWNDFDIDETVDVKQGFVKTKNLQQVCMEVKLDVMKTVDEDMRQELKVLRKALKKDYDRNGKPMPEIMKQPGGKGRKKKKLKATSSKNFADKLLKLAVLGLLKEYPRTQFEDFKGDFNLAGDHLRGNCKLALPFNGETRNIWWERCRELTNGFHKVLLVGASGSGKNTLIHVMATVNNAILFEIDPSQFRDEETSSSTFLQQLVKDLTSCAREAQPCIIHFKNIHQLFYSKTPPEAANLYVNQLKLYLLKKLFKGIQNYDNITVIGTCVDPWLTRSKQILKQFPTVVLMPNTSYSITVQMLKDWVINNRALPPDLDVNTLAYVLQGYNYRYLKQALRNFLSADQIVKIAAKGLNPEEVYNFILKNENITKTDYDNYLKWYQEKTNWGQREKKHQSQQIEFRLLVEKYAAKGKKNKQPSSTTSSMQSVVPSLK